MRELEHTVAFLALEAGTGWHWGWALAHRLGFRDCIVVQQVDELEAEFERRALRAVRGVNADGRQLGVVVLCTRAELSAKLVSCRYGIARSLLGYAAAHGASLVLCTCDESWGMRGHLSALAEALRENETPRVPIHVELFADAH